MSRKLKEVFLHSSAREHGQFSAVGFIFGRKCDINLTVYTHRTIFHIDSRPDKNIRIHVSRFCFCDRSNLNVSTFKKKKKNSLTRGIKFLKCCDERSNGKIVFDSKKKEEEEEKKKRGINVVPP